MRSVQVLLAALVTAAAILPPDLGAQAARTTDGARGKADQFRAVIGWRPDSSGSPASSLTLPDALVAEITAAVPGWRPLRPEEFLYGESPDESHRQATHYALVADFDRDGLSEMILAGVVGQVRVEEGWAQRTAVLVGVRQTAHGFVVQKLLERSDAGMAEENGVLRGGTIMTLQRLSASGRRARSGTTLWARWQEGECKDVGWQWTVRAGQWVKTASDCSYGD